MRCIYVFFWFFADDIDSGDDVVDIVINCASPCESTTSVKSANVGCRTDYRIESGHSHNSTLHSLHHDTIHNDEHQSEFQMSATGASGISIASVHNATTIPPNADIKFECNAGYDECIQSITPLPLPPTSNNNYTDDDTDGNTLDGSIQHQSEYKLPIIKNFEEFVLANAYKSNPIQGK